jgi:hypothetical protein
MMTPSRLFNVVCHRAEYVVLPVFLLLVSLLVLLTMAADITAFGTMNGCWCF